MLLILLLIATYASSAYLVRWDVMNFRVGGINSFFAMWNVLFKACTVVASVLDRLVFIHFV